MKIYTKTGDDGTTSLLAGGRVAKTHLRVQAYGTVDELNAVVGVARASDISENANTLLEQIQNHLLNLGADLATPLNAKADWIKRMDEATVHWLEEQIDTLTADLPELKNFILPGGTLAAAQIHVARTVCRRAERCAIELAHDEAVGDYTVMYLNRLSDLLFTLARWENHQAGISDEKWTAQS